MIRLLIDLYIFVLIADVILSYLPQYKHKQWAQKIKKFADFTCEPVRRLLPPGLPFDFSPIIVFFGLKLAVSLIGALW